MKNATFKNSRAPWLVCGLLAAAAIPIVYAVIRQSQVHADALPTAVRVVKSTNGFQLLRGGKPYFIKGAGGDASKPALKEAGGNSWRTWGSDKLDSELAEAQKLGMTVTAGIWLGHKGDGFNYDDPAAVAAQKEMARQAILRNRNSPALLVWALGNEMETGGNEDNAAMWSAIEDIAKMAHQLDPNHPTMTVVAEIGGDKIKEISTLCPDIDIVGLNTYAGGPSIADRYKAAGGVKPYIVTEYGPPGVWENPKNAWGVVPELTSTEKAARYKATYLKSILNQPLCVGSYAFTWGSKQEATATWFGLVLPDGSKLGPVDALTELWSGHPPTDLCPVIQHIAVEGSAQAAPGAVIKAALAVTDPQNHPLTVQWVLQADPATYKTGGGHESTPPTYPEAIVSSSLTSATVKMPSASGAYRLYAYVHDTHGSAAVANVSLDVPDIAAAPLDTPAAKPVSTAEKATLPLVIYAEDGGAQPYIPSGYMGTAAAIKMDPACTVQPHSGKTCLKIGYTSGADWGGVVWQSPANDWGDKPGGYNLTGAKTLTFWARGDQGGEVVTFLFGLLGKDKTYSDSGTSKVQATLSKEWKQYTISLAGLDLSQIKTGFAWTLAAPGHPVTFYLDDVKYQ